MMTGKTALNNNPKKALAAIGIVYVIPIFLGSTGLFYLQGMEYFISTILTLSVGGILSMLHYVMIPKVHKTRKATNIWSGFWFCYRFCNDNDNVGTNTTNLKIKFFVIDFKNSSINSRVPGYSAIC
jgi:hypothetical protein